MRKIFAITSLVILTAVFLFQTFCFTAFADEPYDVYNYDSNGSAIPSQAGYTAVKSVSGNSLGISDFSSPNDIFVDADGAVFIYRYKQ